jgi:hypothetical protein
MNITPVFYTFYALCLVAGLVLLWSLVKKSGASNHLYLELLQQFRKWEEDDRAYDEREREFLAISRSDQVGMKPWYFSSTLTWLVCDTIPDTNRRAVRTLDRIIDSVAQFCRDHNVKLSTDIKAEEEYRSRDGENFYARVQFSHTPYPKEVWTEVLKAGLRVRY